MTYSRGAVAAAAVAVAVIALVARPRLLVPALLASLPASAIAVAVAYGADALASPDPTSAEAVSQGHDAALAIALCVVAAALVRVALVPLDRWLDSVRLHPVMRRRMTVAFATAALVGAAVTTVALDLPGRVSEQADRFAESAPPDEPARVQQRLTSAGNTSRVDHWQVALDEFAAEPLHGSGAGTYRLVWERRRDVDYTVQEGHSLFLETLAEYGAVGFALLVVALGALLGGIAVRARGPARPLYGTLLAAGLAWAVHAGVDWQWEIPATTLWLFAVGGAALAAMPGAGIVRRTPRRGTRVAIGAGLLVLAVTPAAAALSQLHLNRAARAWERSDCGATIDSANSAIRALSLRAEPYELIGYCDAKLGSPALGVTALEHAVDRDPRNWQLHYGLALVTASAGGDPQPALREARRLNPREALVRDAQLRLRGSDARGRARVARELPLALR
jgi:hypothetical protein